MNRRAPAPFGQSSVEVPPPIPAFSAKGILSPLLVVPSLLPALLALYAPIDVLDRAKWLRTFVEWILNQAPKLDAHANSTIYPQLALLVNCVSIALVPPLSLVVLWQSLSNYPYSLHRRLALGRLDLKQHFLVLLSPAIFLGAIAAMVMIPGDPSWAKGITTQHRGFYALLAALLPYLAALSLGSQLVNIRLFIDTHSIQVRNH